MSIVLFSDSIETLNNALDEAIDQHENNAFGNKWSRDKTELYVSYHWQKKLQIYVKLPQVKVLGMCAIILHQNNKKVGIFLYVQTLRFVA